MTSEPLFFGWCQIGDGIIYNGQRQDCPSPPVARITHPHGGTTTLCQVHLDGWLDNADDDPSIEPVRLHLLTAS
ncbi:hypothetical protein [Streptomyces tendae]|uniref:hypothetical protein n=1 Tax=Streptomyces tendae TaxID=1932 RepID=UPI003D74100E